MRHMKHEKNNIPTNILVLSSVMHLSPQNVTHFMRGFGKKGKIRGYLSEKC